MDVRLDDAQELLRESAREVLARECPMRYVRECMEAPVPEAPALWRRMAELGWIGLVVPEEHGGAGMDWLSMCLLQEELGAVLAPGPVLPTAALTVEALLRAGDPEQRREWLPRIARGELRVAFAQLEAAGREGADGVGLAAQSGSGGYVLDGVKAWVPDAAVCDVLLVPARLDGEPALFWVDAADARVDEIAWLDPTRRVYEVALREVALPPERRLAGGDATGLEAVLDVGRVVLAAEMCGVARRVLDLSVRYATEREQFGKPIGSFQAIQHKCADMLVRVEAVRSAVYYAAWALDQGPDEAPLAAAMAKSYASDACAAVAGDGIQIHGGLGFTWEQDLHLYYKRAKASQQRFGGAAWNDDRIARRLIDEGRPLS